MQFSNTSNNILYMHMVLKYFNDIITNTYEFGRVTLNISSINWKTNKINEKSCNTFTTLVFNSTLSISVQYVTNIYSLLSANVEVYLQVER